MIDDAKIIIALMEREGLSREPSTPDELYHHYRWLSRMTRAEALKHHATAHLITAGGNISRAARSAVVGRGTFYNTPRLNVSRALVCRISKHLRLTGCKSTGRMVYVRPKDLDWRTK